MVDDICESNNIPEDKINIWKTDVQAFVDKQRYKLSDYLFETVKQTDQALLMISSGALSLSTLLAKWMIGDNPKYISLLSASWSLFALTIVLALLSLFASKKTIHERLEELEIYYNVTMQGFDNASDEPEPNITLRKSRTWARITSVLNGIAAISFCTAWIALAWFAFVNINRG
jgi:hypothetical protein